MERLQLVLSSGKHEILVKPNSKKTEVVAFNPLVIAIKAPAQDNKANIELVKFLSRETKKKIRIVSGKTGKRKIVEIY